MNVLRLSGGRPVVLGPRIASGGQGAIHSVDGNDQVLAKIFHQPVDSATHRKLVGAIRLSSSDLQRAAAWPVDILTDPKGLCAGFIMPRITEGHEIDRLAHPGEQRLAFPTIDYGFLVHVAINLARAIGSIHATGCVVGDLNERNVMVLPNGTIRIIDVDSFQIVADGEVFPCPVGSELFTAPELRGQVLANQRRTPNHDAFGMAILIFQLLMLGRHPFAGVPRDGKARTIEDSIRERLYAYSGSPSSPVGAPPDTVSIANLGSLGALFHRAFTSEIRPSASEWLRTLEAEKSRLRRCDRNPRHAVFHGASACALCALPRDPLPANVAPSSIPNVASLRIPELIAEATRLQPLKLLCERQTVGPLQPSERAMVPPGDGGLGSWGVKVGITGLLIGAFIPLPPAARAGAVGVGVLSGIALGVVGAIYRSGLMAQFTAVKQTVDNALGALDSVEGRARFEEASIRSELDGLSRSIKHTCQLLSGAEGRQSRSLEDASRAWAQHRLEEFLRNQLIRNSNIPHVGPSRRAMLASFGIETAADVNHGAVRNVPGFGEELTKRMVAWKADCVRSFRGPGPTPTEWLEKVRQQNVRETADNAARLRADITQYVQRWALYDRRLAELATALDSARGEARRALALRS